MIYTLGDHRPVFLGEHYVAPDAAVIGAVTVGADASIWFKSVVRADNDTITIGDGANVQDLAVLHVDPGAPLVIGNRASIGHQATVHGCTIGARTLIGINAVVLNNAVIGEDCIIGANCFIAEGKVIPPRSLVLGSPGRIVREVSAEQLAEIHQIAQDYIDEAKIYREQLAEQLASS